MEYLHESIVKFYYYNMLTVFLVFGSRLEMGFNLMSSHIPTSSIQ